MLRCFTSFCLSLVIALCAIAQEGDADRNAPSALQRTLTPDGKAPIAPVPEMEDEVDEPDIPTSVELQRAELRKAVSQLMIVTLEGSTLFTSQDRYIMRSYPPGGIVMDTVGRPSFAADYITELRAVSDNPAEGRFALIGTNLFTLPRRDLVQRDRFYQLPSLLSLAASDDPEASKRFGDFLAMSLETMGFNFHLGPSLALAPTISSADGTVHCLGSNPDFAASAAEHIFAAFAEKDIAAMPLHFPGGFNDSVPNSTPVLLTPRNVVAHADLLPYQRAIDAGARMIHVGNIAVPSLDSGNTLASLSKKVMHEILRQDMGFDGVVVAGPIDVTTVTHLMDREEAALRSLVAGADMLYWSSTGTSVQRGVDFIVEAVISGRISADLIEDRVARVEALKTHFNFAEREMPDKGDARKLEKKKRYTEESYEIERRSVTLLYNRDKTLPFTKERSMPLLITGVSETSRFLDEFRERFKKAPIYVQPIVSAKHAGRIHDFEIDRVVKRAKGLGTALCVFDSSQELQGQLQIVRRLKQKGVRVVVVLLGYPNTVSRFRDADAIVLAYAESGYIAQSIPAIVDVLVGNAPVRILTPVRDMETRVGKTEVFNAYHVVQTPAGRLPVGTEAPFLAGLAVPYDIDDTVDKVEWDFGDGDREKGFIVEYSYEAPGRYPITLTVTDQNGEEYSRSFYAAVAP